MTIQDYMRGIKETPFKWATRNGISPWALYKILRGKPPTVEIAKKIRRATNLAVDWDDLYPDGEREVRSAG